MYFLLLSISRKWKIIVKSIVLIENDRFVVHSSRFDQNSSMFLIYSHMQEARCSTKCSPPTLSHATVPIEMSLTAYIRALLLVDEGDRRQSEMGFIPPGKGWGELCNYLQRSDCHYVHNIMYNYAALLSIDWDDFF